jgi:ribosomal protein S18 acetylase RimI-like enzyme
MNQNLIVRRANPRDLKTIQDLNHDLFVSDNNWLHDLNENWPYEPEGKAYFTKRVQGDNGICFVAEADGKIVGYAAGGWSHINFSAYKGKRGELENICVKDGFRGEGIGAKLVTALYDWFKDQGATHVMVNAYTQNTKAIEFYMRQGFEHYSTTLWRKL